MLEQVCYTFSYFILRIQYPRRTVFLSGKYNLNLYENSSKEYVDIDPTVGPGSGLLPITWLDRLSEKNNEQREIRVLRDDTVDEVAKAFRDALKF